jgi:hypothetical protein
MNGQKQTKEDKKWKEFRKKSPRRGVINTQI